MFRKLDLFPSSGKRVGRYFTKRQPLERAHLADAGVQINSRIPQELLTVTHFCVTSVTLLSRLDTAVYMFRCRFVDLCSQCYSRHLHRLS